MQTLHYEVLDLDQQIVFLEADLESELMWSMLFPRVCSIVRHVAFGGASPTQKRQAGRLICVQGFIEVYRSFICYPPKPEGHRNRKLGQPHPPFVVCLFARAPRESLLFGIRKS